MTKIKICLLSARIPIALTCIVALMFVSTVQAQAPNGNSKKVPKHVAQMVGQMADAMTAAVLAASPKQRTVAVVDFQNIGPDVEEMKIGETVSDLLNAAMVKSGKVVVIDRKNIRKVMEEIALGQTGLVDEATAAQAGSIVGASVIITGAVSHVGTIFYATSRAIDVRTAKVVGVHTARIPDELLIPVAAQYYDLHRYPVNAIFRSMLVPGWGQFFNNQPKKGYLIMGTEVVLIASAAVFHFYAANYYDEYHKDDPDTAGEGDKGDRMLLGRNISLGIAGGV